MMPVDLFNQMNLTEAEINEKINNSKRKANRLAKKERKLWMIFVKRFLNESVIKSDKSHLGSNRNLLIDNRDYALSYSTELLIQTIQKDLQGLLIEDVFVLPSKTFVLIRFSSFEICTNVQQYLNEAVSLLGPINFVSVSDHIFDIVITKYSSDLIEILELFDKKPAGLKVLENFISVDEEKSLFQLVESCFSDPNYELNVSKIKNRKAVHFGFVFDYQLNSISFDDNPGISVIDQKLPPECQLILERLYKSGLIPEMADQLTINHYDGSNGDHIPLHCDTHSMCSDWIVSLNVGTDVVMTFDNLRTSDKVLRVLPARSIMLMTDEVRYLWRHGILQTSFDFVPWSSTEMFQNELSHKRLALKKRGLRYSFTFRKIRSSDFVCRCLYPESCNSQLSSKNIELNEQLNISKAEELELSFVHHTYDDIAEHFSSTRYGCWPRVVQFLNSLPDGSLVIDVGCGNGKYLSVDQNRIVSIGTDRSNNLLQICRQRNFETFFDDCLNVDRTLRPNMFDAAICIAVIHHMASEDRRLHAIHSLVNLLSVGGRALIYVWAFEQKHNGTSSKYLRDSNTTGSSHNIEQKQPLNIHRNRSQFQQQDVFVPWTKMNTQTPDTKLRYYHVFREGELQSLIERLPEGMIQIEQIYYDQGNWCAIIKRFK